MARIRVSLLIVVILFSYASLVFNIYNLQIEKGEYFAVRAESQYRLAGFLKAERGNIYFTDKNNNLIPAALNKEFNVIFAVPNEIEDIQKTATALSEALDIPKDQIEKYLSKPDDLYELLVDKATSEQVAKIKELKLKGIYVDGQKYRFYPFGELAAHLLGFVGPSNKDADVEGRYGIELYFNEELKGIDGRVDPATDGSERVIEPIDGKDIVLTIDRNIQARAEEILRNLIKNYNAEGGSVMVADPSTGKLLAMGSYPTFDPNNYSQYKVSNFLNPAVQSIYEPGSIFKVLTMAAGIDSGKITPRTTFYDPGSVTYNGYTIKNWDLKSHGKITMTEVIEQSINTGAVFAERETGHDNFYNYLLRFGFGEKTNIKLPGELAGSLANLAGDFRDINFATASFGQGVSVTPIQLIMAISAIANGGYLMEPRLLESDSPRVVRNIISSNSGNQVREMMVSAVRKAQVAQIPNYSIAGKTGTAQIPDFNRGGYTDQVINTYVGFAPASDPKFIILFKLNKPAGAPLAGLTVVPAFRELAEFILNYYNISPDNL